MEENLALKQERSIFDFASIQLQHQTICMHREAQCARTIINSVG